MKLSLYGSALVALLGCASAHASIIYDFQNVTPVGANFDWKYIARLSADQKLVAGTPMFAVVYDFFGVLSASTSNVVAGLTLNNFLENTTSPQPVFQNVADDPNQKNVHTTISGSFTPSVLTGIYTIDIISTIGARGTFAAESAQATKNVPGDASDGAPVGNTTLIEAPGAATPEPATMALMGSALIGIGFIRRRSKS